MVGLGPLQGEREMRWRWEIASSKWWAGGVFNSCLLRIRIKTETSTESREMNNYDKINVRDGIITKRRNEASSSPLFKPPPTRLILSTVPRQRVRVTSLHSPQRPIVSPRQSMGAERAGSRRSISPSVYGKQTVKGVVTATWLILSLIFGTVLANKKMYHTIVNQERI